VTVQTFRARWRSISVPTAPAIRSGLAIARQTDLEPSAPTDFELLQHAEHLIAS
jgi:hypothetical protein